MLCTAAGEELKCHILKANEKGMYFPDDMIELINKFLSGNPISPEEFQMIYVLPDEIADDKEDPSGSQSQSADESQVCIPKMLAVLSVCHFCFSSL